MIKNKLVLQQHARLDVSNGQHQYYYRDRPIDHSVTTRLEKDILGTEFKAFLIASAIYKLCNKIRAKPDDTYKQDQLDNYDKYKDFKSAASIVQSWNDNRDRGTEMHKTIEMMLNGDPVENDMLTTSEIAIFVSFYHMFCKTYEPVAAEAVIIHEKISLGGCIDSIWQKRGGKPNEIVLVDWKKMGPCIIVDSDDKRCLAFYDLPSCTRVKQNLQLNVYAELIHRLTKYIVIEMFIVYIDVVNGLDVSPVPFYREETAAYIDSM